MNIDILALQTWSHEEENADRPHHARLLRDAARELLELRRLRDGISMDALPPAALRNEMLLYCAWNAGRVALTYAAGDSNVLAEDALIGFASQLEREARGETQSEFEAWKQYENNMAAAVASMKPLTADEFLTAIDEARVNPPDVGGSWPGGRAA